MTQPPSGPISQCWQAYADTDPWVLAAPDVHWVMNLDAYKRIRAAAKFPGGDDPGKWEPDPADLLLAMPVEVREDGGEPHLVSVLAWQKTDESKRAWLEEHRRRDDAVGQLSR